MAISIPENDFEDPETGVYRAACVGIFLLPAQEEEWEGVSSVKDKLVFRFELEEEDSNGEPFTMQRWCTVTGSKNGNLSKLLTGWAGKAVNLSELDVEALLGQSCMVSVIPKQSGVGVTVGEVSPCRKNPYEPMGELILVDDETEDCPDGFSESLWERVLEGRKRLARTAREAASKKKAAAIVRQPEDKIPPPF